MRTLGTAGACYRGQRGNARISTKSVGSPSSFNRRVEPGARWHLSISPTLLRCSYPFCQRRCAGTYPSHQRCCAVLIRSANAAARLLLRSQAERKAAPLRVRQDERSATAAQSGRTKGSSPPGQARRKEKRPHPLQCCVNYGEAFYFDKRLVLKKT